MSDVTKQLAQFVVNSRWADIPSNVRHEGQRAMLNWLGCALGGSQEVTVDYLLVALREFAGKPQATLIGRMERYDILTTACVNAVGSNILDFDDTHLRTVIHPTVPVAAALLALAEYRALGGREFLHALILGIEVECRVGNGLSPELFEAGWHTTAVCGVIGAAAACGKAVGLNVAQMTYALGIAATQSSGLSDMFGSMSKSYNMGHAARNGLAAAMFALAGITSSTHAIESMRGLLGVVGRGGHPKEITFELGSKWEMLNVAYKPYPCGIVTHPVIDACLDLKNSYHLHASHIACVEVAVDPIALDICTKNRIPANGLEGKLSLHHSAAIALIDGAAGIPQYSDERVVDPRVAVLREKVIVIASPEVGKGQARVRVTLSDGIQHAIYIEHARGSLERPLVDTELEEKFCALAEMASVDTDTIQSTIARCWSLAKLADAGDLARTHY